MMKIFCQSSGRLGSLTDPSTLAPQLLSNAIFRLMSGLAHLASSSRGSTVRSKTMRCGRRKPIWRRSKPCKLGAPRTNRGLACRAEAMPSSASQSRRRPLRFALCKFPKSPIALYGAI